MPLMQINGDFLNKFKFICFTYFKVMQRTGRKVMNQSFSVRQSLSLTTTVSTFPPSNFGKSMPCRSSIRRLLVSCCCLFHIITIDAFRASHSLLALPLSSDHSLNIFLIIGLSPAQVVNDCNNSKEPYIYVAKHRPHPRCVLMCVVARVCLWCACFVPLLLP